MLKKSQIGRSMIEMLGVLAIIGVLSVGGLAGYSRAMRKHKVNDALDYMSRAWVEFNAQKAAGHIASQTAYPCDDLLDEDMPSALDGCQFQSSSYAGYDNYLFLHFATGELLLEAISRLGTTNSHYTENSISHGVTNAQVSLLMNDTRSTNQTYAWNNYE